MNTNEIIEENYFVDPCGAILGNMIAEVHDTLEINKKLILSGLLTKVKKLPKSVLLICLPSGS